MGVSMECMIYIMENFPFHNVFEKNWMNYIKEELVIINNGYS